MSHPEERADGPMIVRAMDKGKFVRVNGSFKAEVGFDAAELSEEPFLNWIAPCDRERVQSALTSGAKRFCARHIARDGDALRLEFQVAEHEEGRFLLGRSVMPSDRPEPYSARAEATVLGTLDTIARIMEEQHTGYKCSILLVADGRFVSGAGPSLPAEYNSAIDGYAVGPTVGSCGTAIFWGVPVIVEDIQADPLWKSLADLARKAGVAACWSHPFVSKQGKVLGALALYFPEPRAPTTRQLIELRAAARMTGLAVERGRAEDELRKNQERELALKADLRTSLHEKETLLREIHHRVKNNLQVIASLLFFRAKKLTDPASAEVFAEVREQLRSMMLVHEKLYRSNDLARIDFGDYLRTLVPEIAKARAKKTQVAVSVEAANVLLPIETAIPCCLLVSELLTNALKHGFPDARGGRIEVRSSLDAGELALTVSDDGVGLPEEFDPSHSDSFGWQLIHALAGQLGGSVDVARQGGTVVRLILPLSSETSA